MAKLAVCDTPTPEPKLVVDTHSPEVMQALQLMTQRIEAQEKDEAAKALIPQKPAQVRVFTVQPEANLPAPANYFGFSNITQPDSVVGAARGLTDSVRQEQIQQLQATARQEAP